MKRRRQVVIKGSSLPVLRIVVRDGDASALRAELIDTIDNARPLLAEAIAVLDLREHAGGAVGPREIVEAVRDAGLRLAAVLIGEPGARSALAHLDLPVIEAPLATRDRNGREASANEAAADTPDPWSSASSGSPTVEPSADASTGGSTEAAAQSSADAPSESPPESTIARNGAPHASRPANGTGLPPAYLTRPLRSGQRFYAQGRDVVVAAPTSRGSELIADGSIYAFSAIRGRVLAGASGNASACIVAHHFDAELVAVAGVYRTFEAQDVRALGGGPVSVTLWLDPDGNERLTVASLESSSSMQRTQES